MLNNAKRIYGLILAFTLLLCGNIPTFAADSESIYYNQMSDATRIIYNKVINLEGDTQFEKEMYPNMILHVHKSELIYNNIRRNINDEDYSIVPYYENNTVMLPASSLSSFWGYDVVNDNYYNFVDLKYDGDTVRVFPEKTYVKYNNTEKLVKQQPVVLGDEIYVSHDVMELLLGKKISVYNDVIVISDKLYSQKFHKNTLKKIHANYLNEAEPVCYYVSVNDGNDSFSGKVADVNARKTDGPVKTIERAKELVRSVVASEMDRDVIVYIKGGEYIFENSVNFTSKDSGNNWHNVIYTTYANDEVSIVGAQPMSGWKKYDENIYCIYVGDREFSALYEDGTRGVEARWPNEGKYSYATAYTSPDNPSPSSVSFRFSDDFPQITPKEDEISILRWSGGPDGYWYWNTFIHDVKSIDYTNRAITLTSGYNAYVFGTGTAYYIKNSFDLLDAPGEFYLDKERSTLYYWPRNEFDENKIYIPDKNLQAFFTFEDYKNPIMLKKSESGSILQFTAGDMKAYPTKNITIDGLEMKYTDQMNSAVRISNGKNITVKNCKMFCLGEGAVDMYNFAVNNSVYGNLIYNVGASAIKISDTKRYIDAVGYNDIINNYIYDTGVLNRGIPSIRVWDSGHNRIQHNVVHDMDGAAILAAGSEFTGKTTRVDGYNYSRAEIEEHFVTCRENIIAYNDVYASNRHRQDSGAIYTARCINTKVHDNSIHDTYTPFQFGFVLYLDDMSCNTQCYNNICYNVQNPKQYPDYYVNGETTGIYISKGDDISLYNNISADCYVAEYYTDYKGERVKNEHAIFQNTYDLVESTRTYSGYRNRWFRNIGYNSGRNALGIKSWGAGQMDYCDYNIYYYDGYNSEEDYYVTGGKAPATNIKEWKSIDKEKYDSHSLISDPLFVDTEAYDYRIRYDSPAYIQKFEDINYENIGLKDDYELFSGEEPLKKLFVKTSDTHAGIANINMKSGDQKQLIVSAKTDKYSKANLENAQITYQSSDDSIASVDKNGTVTANGSGVAEIMVTASKNGVTVNCKMYVLVDDYVVDIVHNSKIMQAALSMGSTYNLAEETVLVTKFGQYIAGTSENPVFTSFNKNVATVTNKGMLNSKGAGNTFVNISLDTMVGKVNELLSINVVESRLAHADIDNEMYAILKGDNTIKITGVLENGKIADMSGIEVTADIANVDLCKINSISGNEIHITGLKTGITKITLEFKYDGVTQQISKDFLVVDEKVTDISKFTVNNYDASGDIESDGIGLIIRSNGKNIWNNADQCTYASFNHDMSDSENIIIAGKIAVIEETSSTDASVGIMIRDKKDSTSYNVNIRGRADGASQAVWRNDTNPASWYATATVNSEMPYYFALIKEGNTTSAYILDEKGWKKVKEVNISFSDDISVGLCAFGAATESEFISGRVTDLYVGY